MTPVHGADGTATSSRASSTVDIQQRERINGWSCPWHPLQFIAWFFLIFFSLFYFGVIVFYLPNEWQPAGFIIPGGFCVIHVVYHLLALTIDPADPNIRSGSKKRKAYFDRNQHQHVIENSHCYICQVDVGSKSKHCSVCNKCVSDFDHHCKWLNNCVGGQNYRLFIGCVSSAFVLAVLVFAVTMYVFVMCFTSRDSLKLLSGGEFKLFVTVSSDELFISFIGVMAGLLLLSIALLGHLLGFHIYLIYHKLSTYEFIVSSRDQRSETSDAEAGTNKSPTSRKLFKNKVKPEDDGRANEEPERIEISDHAGSVGSEDTLPNETTVKFINEVSSKAAAKQNRCNVEQEPSQRQDQPSSTTPNIANYTPQGITECASSSEESLKEITPPPATPQVRSIQQPAGTSQPLAEISSNQYHNETSQSIAGPRKVPMVTFEDEVGERVPGSQRKKKRKTRASEDTNTETLNNGNYELTAVNVNGSVHAGQDSVDAVTPRKKKKKRVKATASDTLPPVVVRRPLPQLQLQEDN